MATLFERQNEYVRKGYFKHDNYLSDRSLIEEIQGDRTAFCDNITQILRKELRLSRCGIIGPSSFDRKQWKVFSIEGFQNSDYLNELYTVGEGLTGSVLDSNATVHEFNMEGSRTWSRKFGKDYCRNDGDIGPIAYLGVPLCVADSPLNPYGVLMATRSWFGTRASKCPIPGWFLDHEVDLVRTVAAYVSNMLSVFYGREERVRENQRLQLFVDGFSPTLTVAETDRRFVKYIQQLLPVAKTLVSNINPFLDRVDGREVHRFRNQLLADTRRRYYRIEGCPVDTEIQIHGSSDWFMPYVGEDILSWVVRSGNETPLIVSAENKLVNQVDRKIHQANGLLLVLPCSISGNTEAVVLSELKVTAHIDKIDSKTIMPVTCNEAFRILGPWLRDRSQWYRIDQVRRLCREYAIFLRAEKRRIIDSAIHECSATIRFPFSDN